MDGAKAIKQGGHLELSYLHGGEVVYQPGDSLGPRVLHDFEIVYIVEGEVVYESDGQRYEIGPGGFVLGRPGFREMYHWDPANRTRHTFMHFGIACCPGDWPDPEDWPRVQQRPASLCAPLFQRILQRIVEHGASLYTRPEPKDCRLVASLIDALLEPSFTEGFSLERDRPEPVRRALMHIRRVVEANPHHSLSLAELAAEAHVTEKYLCRLFAKWVGFPPVQTYTLLRLESAMLLLARTNLSVKEVAQRCGFDNALYFSRLFSRTCGLSPTAFRKELVQGRVGPRTFLPSDLFPRVHF